MRICHLITELGPAGAERGVYELARRLDRGHFDVQVAALRGGEVADWLRGAGVKVTVLGVRGKWDMLKLRRLKRLLHDQRIDLLHTHLFHADLAGRLAARKAGVPHLVHTVWTAEGRFRPWQFAFARLTRRRCDRIICLAESVRDFHSARSGLPRAAYTVIPWGIDATEYSRDDDARGRLRSQWGIGERDVLAAFVGRLEFYKGVDTLLAAMGRLGAAGEPVRLVIAGDGPRRQAVEGFIARAEGGGHVRLLGFVRDVRAVLSAADVYLMPSLWEGWGLALGEAMSAGLPAIGTDVPGIRDLIVDGQTGLLVPREDPAALADAIRRLAGDADLRRRLGEAGRQRIVQHFSLDAAVRAHEALYEHVAGARGGK